MKYIFYSLLFSVNYSLISMEYHNIYEKLEEAQQEKNLSIYKKCITKLLPFELCKKIDTLYALINNEKIKNSFTKNVAVKDEFHQIYRSKLQISNNGHYYIHNLSTGSYDIAIKLMDINDDNNIIKKFYPQNYTIIDDTIVFSPNNKYFVIQETKGMSFYNLITKKSYPLLEKEKYCDDIIISDDSKHILLREFTEITRDDIHYTLWTLGSQETPHLNVHLKSELPIRDAIFHPDNKHIIHSPRYDQLDAYDLDSSKNKIIKPYSKEENIFIHTLSTTADNKKIIASTNTNTNILFNIDNLDNITSVVLPKGAPFQKILCIPYKNLIAYVPYNQKRLTVKLLDEKAQTIASHTSSNNAQINTDLATDITGNYLAVGYSDGTIMIWHLFDIKQYPNEKVFIKSNNAITSLTFSDNHLLLSQSKSDEFWKIAEPSIQGTAILWDVYGNEIINFGDNIVASTMSKNGKTIIVVSAELQWNIGGLSSRNPYLTLTTYHNKNQTDDYIPNNEFTLSQLYMLMTHK